MQSPKVGMISPVISHINQQYPVLLSIFQWCPKGAKTINMNIHVIIIYEHSNECC